MDMKLLQDLKNSWRNCNAATSGFLASVPAELLSSRPFEPRFKSYAWEIACLIRTRLVYLDALIGNPLDFSERPGTPDKALLEREPKGELAERLSRTSNEVLACIEQLKTSAQVSLVVWLLQHERIHHGKLMLYLSQDRLPLPESFVQTWGESNFISEAPKH